MTINGHNSEPFNISSGVRQGDPLSCVLFDLVIETLALAITQKNALPGFIDSKGRRIKLSMFADDTMVLTDKKQWGAFRSVYKMYSKATGSNLNEEKCEAVAAGVKGEQQGRLAHRIPIKVNELARYLGAPIGTNLNYDIAWLKILKELKGIIAK